MDPNLMARVRNSLLVLSVAAASLFCFVEARIVLDPISVLYVPYDYDVNGTGLYKIAGGASEQSTYDYQNHLLYISGDYFIQIVDVSDPSEPNIIYRHALDSPSNDIEVCGDVVGFVQNGATYRVDTGTLSLYNLYDVENGNWSRLYEIPVGSIPDMLYFTKDCQTIVVVNEGEYGVTADPDVYVDPEGLVSIIRLDQDLANGYRITNLNFTRFNEDAESYEERGVRYLYKNTTFSQNLEPEYIAFSSDDRTAYISLQENNAIAVIDLNSEDIVDIYPLGEKSWKDLRIDASDMDGGTELRQYDIYSFYQPDAIKYFEVDGTGYIVTANEGAGVEYSDWAEEKRGKALVEDGLVWAESDLLSALNDTAQLGRLKFSQYEGVNSSRFNKLDRFYFFGGRSISIRRASDMALVHDTGDEIERQSSVLLREVFNADTKPINVSPSEASDLRSDDSGAECESLAFGELDGRRILFVGIERLSAIAIYTFAPGSAVPVFDGFHRAGGIDRTYEQLLADRNLGDLDPEDIKFLSSEKSPTNSPMLVVTNNIAGSIAFYDVTDVPDSTMTTPTSGSSANHADSFLTLAWIVASIVQFTLRRQFM
ncbi:mesenchyme-specific cell surface glycoprotein-like [Diadema setosum]|uniref:mesenchyme-specific cell surface glycoprotein-like n=1 Tax=Diadema setosum TaxID=31175 RepID=UPI003B3B3992